MYLERRNHATKHIKDKNGPLAVLICSVLRIIGNAVWNQKSKDIGDAISIGKSVRKTYSPIEIEQIINTMTKYVDA